MKSGKKNQSLNRKEKQVQPDSKRVDPLKKNLHSNGQDSKISDRQNQLDKKEEEVRQLRLEKEALAKKMVEYENLIKRQQAEFDNYRKRINSERENLAKYASDQLLKDFINIYDHFGKAIEIDAEDGALKKYIQGFRLIKEQLDKMLENHGVSSSTSVGDFFNPDYHQAIQVEDEGGEVEKIKEIYQKGYFLHDRLLREAVVKVHKVNSEEEN